MIDKTERKHGIIPGWRKSKYWRRGLKSLMRSLGRASSSGGKNKKSRVKEITSLYIQKSVLLSDKIIQSLPLLPFSDVIDLSIIMLLEY
jgi:hypothetical protein